MAFVYEVSPETTALRQAEVLLNLTEYRAVGLSDTGNLEYLVVPHAAVIIMSQDCDVEQDCDLRFPPEGDPVPAEEVELHANSLAQVLLCDAYGEDAIRDRVRNFGSKDWKRVDQNQNERYHRFDSGPIGSDQGDVIEAMYIDFRKHFTVPTGFLYDRIAAGDVKRRAVIPPIHSHDLMHRFYGYQSRIAVL